MIADLARHIEGGADLRDNITPERLLQGPFSDAMTHAGQLALLRRLAGSPVRPENFIAADIHATRLGPDYGAGEPGRTLAGSTRSFDLIAEAVTACATSTRCGRPCRS